MMGPFFVRTAMVRDLPAVSALLSATWHATYASLYGAEKVEEVTRAWHSVDALEPRIGRLSSEFIVADDGTRIGGMAFAACSDADRRLVMLHQLYVLPALQRQGIGRELLGEIVAAFPEAERVRCEVDRRNSVAIAFYEIHGFRDVGPADAAGSDGEGAHMRLLERPL